jgi:hypothetical protein
MLAPGVIIIWPGTHASIPAGFSRVTALDGKYPKIAVVEQEAGETGGAATHTHTSPSHTHEINPHTHTYTAANEVGGTSQADMTSVLSQKNHTHSGSTGAVVGGTTGSTAVTYGSESNDPPFYTVIYIKATGWRQIPDNSVILFNGAEIPEDFELTDGENETVDLTGKFLKGADTAANAGDEGGSTTNEHDITHTHTANSHSHAGSTSGTPSVVAGGSNNSPGIGARGDHTHAATFGSSTQAINSCTDTLTTLETVEPEYKKIAAIQNKSGVGKVAKPGMIAYWDGDVVDIPPGWLLCDGEDEDELTLDFRGKHIKIADTLEQIGDEGGSNTHTHAAQSHSHTGNGSHSHSVSLAAAVSAFQKDGSGQNVSENGHTHSGTTDGSTINYASANTTANESSNEPEYSTVHMIQFFNSQLNASIINQFL